MAEPPVDSAAEPNCTATLAALEQRGMDRVAPVRFAYLAALARRAASQPEAIRRLLTEKIAREAEELAKRSPRHRADETEHPAHAAGNPLAELLSYIAEHTVALPTPSLVSAVMESKPHAKAEPFSPPAPELKSVAYFRSTWSKLVTDQQLTQTLAKAPENAGPMNSQHLVLRALQLMRERSPDYLQGFMAYIDTLVWLEQASSTKPLATRPTTGESETKVKATKRGAGKRGTDQGR